MRTIRFLQFIHNVHSASSTHLNTAISAKPTFSVVGETPVMMNAIQLTVFFTDSLYRPEL
jgi:hypothetical protein